MCNSRHTFASAIVSPAVRKNEDTRTRRGFFYLSLPPVGQFDVVVDQIPSLCLRSRCALILPFVLSGYTIRTYPLHRFFLFNDLRRLFTSRVSPVRSFPHLPPTTLTYGKRPLFLDCRRCSAQGSSIEPVTKDLTTEVYQAQGCREEE